MDIFKTLSSIPRQACLGLIEAHIHVVHAFSRLFVFRGKLASASLKPRLPPHTDAPNLIGIPRQACLGLIEARIGTLNAVTRLVYSEASLPRPH